MARLADTVSGGGLDSTPGAHGVTCVSMQRYLLLYTLRPVLRKAISTTNAIESVNSVIRKFTRNRKIYPNEESALKITFMAIREASKKWTMPIRNWKAALNHFAILFEDRLPMQLP